MARYLDEQLHNLPAAHDIVLAQAEVSQVSAARENLALRRKRAQQGERAMSEQSYRSAGTLLAQLASEKPPQWRW